MKSIILFLCLALLCLGVTYAQTVDATAYSSLFASTASRNRPAVLGTGSERIGITLAGISAGASNTLITRGMATRLAQGDLSNLALWMTEVKENETFRMDATLQLLSGSVTLGPKGEQGFSFGWGISDRFQASTSLPGSAFQLAWQGNAPFEGQTVDMQFDARGIWMREYALGFAMPFHIPGDKWQLRLGARAKYLQGIAAFQTEKANVSLYTAPGGNYLDVGYDYRVQSTLDPEAESPFSPKNILQPSGKGIGYDLGLQVGYGKNFRAELNVLDAGAVNFDPGLATLTYSHKGDFRFSGVVIENTGEGSPAVNTDFLDSLVAPERTTGETISYKLSSRIRAQATFQIPAKTLKGVTYPMHAVSVAYTDYFAKEGGSNLEAAYTYNLLNILETTVLAGSGQGHSYVGAFVGIRAAAIRLGIGSRDLSSFVSSNSKGISADGILSLGF